MKSTSKDRNSRLLTTSSADVGAPNDRRTRSTTRELNMAMLGGNSTLSRPQGAREPGMAIPGENITQPTENCPVCSNLYKSAMTHLSKATDEAHVKEYTRMQTESSCCVCRKACTSFSNWNKFRAHEKACLKTQQGDVTDKAGDCFESTDDHTLPTSTANTSSTDSPPRYYEQQRLNGGVTNNLSHDFTPADHDAAPRMDYERKPQVKWPKAADAKAWEALSEHLVRAAATLGYEYAYSPIDELVEKYENVLHAAGETHCGLHEVPVEEHPHRSKKTNLSNKEKRAKKEKAELQRRMRAVKKGSVVLTDHNKKQLTRKMRLVTKQRKQLKDVREAKMLARKQATAQRKFRKDQWQFAKELFDPPNATMPTFDSDAAWAHFNKTNSDAERSNVLEAMTGWVRPDLPTFAFEMEEPSQQNLKDAVRSKKTKCAPGMNGIPYLVYKKCPELLASLILIFKRVWKERVVPQRWQCGFIILIPKGTTKDTSDPSEFRPITMLNAEGRLFFTLMEWRLTTYMTSNGYIDATIQKGFMPKVAGCVEHSETAYRGILDARQYKQDLCISWVDLANAYGSVKHSLIHFALDWYHVPKHYRELIFKYYERLMARVTVPGAALSAWFWFSKGVFQGCTLSTVLFNAAFNTSFAHMDAVKPNCDYVFQGRVRKINLRLMLSGYADDVCVMTGSRPGISAAKNNETVLKRLQEWLSWSQSMKAKPKKCIAAGLVGGKAADPDLQVWRSEDKWWPQNLGDDVFKHLGKGLNAEGTHEWALKAIKAKFKSLLEAIDGCLLDAIGKVWILDNMAMARMGWQFLISDIPLSFVETDLQPLQTRYLKKWTRLAKTADPSIFYRSHEHHGLGLTQATEHFMKQQLIRRHQLAHSNDPTVRSIHNEVVASQKSRKARGTNEWKVGLELEKLVAEVKTSKMVGRASQGAGVGYGVRLSKAKTKSQLERTLAMSIFHEMEESKRVVEVITNKEHFGEWVRTHDVIGLDMRWESLALKSESYLTYVLNSIEDTLPTPSVLKCWRQANEQQSRCPLGCGHAGSLKHILACCPAAHNEKPQNRIKWRHDSILLAIYTAIRTRTNSEDQPCAHSEFEEQRTVFRTAAGSAAVTKPTTAKRDTAILDMADDWKIQFDLELQAGSPAPDNFPAEVAVVTGIGSRPDGIMWSMEKKIVVWIELTSPWEENLTKNHYLKKNRYNQLAIDLREGKHHGVKWKVYPFYVEVGCRGMINEQPWHSMCKQLGFTSKMKRGLTRTVQNVAVLCSQVIFQNRFKRIWDQQALLTAFVDGDSAGPIPRRGGISKISNEERTERATKRSAAEEGIPSDWQPPKSYSETETSTCRNPLFEAQWCST